MVTIPANHTTQTSLPIDLAPVSGGAKFDQDGGPSFKDHLQDVSRPPVNSDQRQESYDEQSPVEAQRSEPGAAVSDQPARSTETTDDSREGEEPQAEVNDTATNRNESTADNSDEETPVEDREQSTVSDEAADVPAAPVAEGEAILENGDAKSTDTILAQQDKSAIAQGEVTTAETATDQAETDPVLNLSGRKQKSEKNQATTKQVDQVTKTDQGEGGRSNAVEEVTVKQTSDTIKETASQTTAKPDQASAKAPENGTVAATTVDTKQVVEASEQLVAEKTTGKTDDSRKTTSPKQPAAEPTNKAGEATGDEVKVVQPTKEQLSSESEPSDRKSKDEAVTKPKGKSPNPSPATLAQKLAPEVTTQSTAELSSSESIKAATTQVQVSVADGVEVTSPEETVRNPQRVETGGEDFKPATQIVSKTGEVNSEAATRVVSEATEAKETIRTDATRQHPEVDRARFVQRVARAFNSVANRGGTLRLRLSPPELGSLKIEIDVRGSTMTARIEAETSAARSVLLESLPALRERLADQNIKIDKFDVDLLNQSPDDSFRQPAGNHDRQDERSPLGNTPRGNGNIAADQETSTGNTTPGLGEDTQLNVVV